MGFSSFSSMNTSIKYNASLRRARKGNHTFNKKSEFTSEAISPLSREENLRIIQENKKILARKTKDKRLFGIFMVLLYGSIIAYVVSLLI